MCGSFYLFRATQKISYATTGSLDEPMKYKNNYLLSQLILVKSVHTCRGGESPQQPVHRTTVLRL
jgi:hypothetical protein